MKWKGGRTITYRRSRQKSFGNQQRVSFVLTSVDSANKDRQPCKGSRFLGLGDHQRGMLPDRVTTPGALMTCSLLPFWCEGPAWGRGAGWGLRLLQRCHEVVTADLVASQ